MLTEERVNGEYLTDDLGLAAFLELEGHTHQRLMRRGERKAVWVFDRNSTLEELVNQFQSGDARVEPLKYQRSLTETRRDMFDFLDAL